MWLYGDATSDMRKEEHFFSSVPATKGLSCLALYVSCREDPHRLVGQPFFKGKGKPHLWVRLLIRLKANCLPRISFALVKGQSYEVGIEEATPTALVG